MRSCSTVTASSRSCRGCSRAGCPISISARRAAQAARRRCAPRSPPFSRSNARSRTSSTAASRAATSRAITDGRARTGMRCSSRCASRATWRSARRSPTTIRVRDRLAPGAGEARGNDDRVEAARWRIAARNCGRRSRGSTARGANACCSRSMTAGTGRRSSAGVNDAPPGATALAGPALARTGERAQPRFPARVRGPGRASRCGGRRLLVMARAHVRGREPHRARASCARSRRGSTSRCCAAATRRSANSTICTTRRTAAATPTRSSCQRALCDAATATGIGLTVLPVALRTRRLRRGAVCATINADSRRRSTT